MVLLLLSALCLAACERDSKDAAVRIMPLGNSITQGDMNHPTYRFHLWKMLLSDGYAADFVGTVQTNYKGPNPEPDFDQDHQGHWGWRTDQVLNGISGKDRLSDVLKQAAPDIVLLHLGSNDIFQGEPVDQIVSELRDIVATLHLSNHNVTIFIAQILPVANTAINAHIARLNSEIKKLPESPGIAATLLVVNQFEGFDPYSHTYDGVHPNTAGELRMAEKWYAALRPVLREMVTGQQRVQ